MVLRPSTEAFLSTDMTVTAWETNLTPTNGSDQAFHLHYIGIIILDLLTAIVVMGGLAGNMVVLWLLGFHMHKNTFSVYILNLAGADFLFLCIGTLRSLFEFSFVLRGFSRFTVPVSIFAYISGLSFLSAISTERCLSVLWPIWYRCRRPRHMSAIMCALLWALSLLLSILEGNYCGFLVRNMHHVWCRVLDFITAAWLILLFVILTGSSLALMTRLLCGSNRVPLTRLYATIVLTVLVFLLCGLPFGIHWFLLIWFQKDFDDLVPSYLVAFLLSCVNSGANPIIYFFVGSFRRRWWKRRHTLRLVLQRALQDTPEVAEPGGSLPGGSLAMSGNLVS